jgi:streptomycin 6-kinase
MMVPVSTPVNVEPGFRAFVTRMFGEEGRAWIATLPTVHAELATRWQLDLGSELTGGLLSCVREAARFDGSAAVLKIGVPWLRTSDEIATLRAWDGNGAALLLEADEQLGALLLERVQPGTHPTSATAAGVAAVLRALHIPPLAGLDPLGVLARRRITRALDQGRTTGAKAEWALAKVVELEQDPPPPVLLHGDFDERNLLTCTRRGLCAIDPLPCVGDPAYDGAYWVHGNRRPGRRARLDAIVELGYDRARVRDWAAIVGVHG